MNISEINEELSHIKVVLSNLRAVLEKKASKDQVSFTIGDRSLSRASPEELLRWQKEYRNRRSVLQRKLDLATGRSGRRNKIQTRFV